MMTATALASRRSLASVAALSSHSRAILTRSSPFGLGSRRASPPHCNVSASSLLFFLSPPQCRRSFATSSSHSASPTIQSVVPEICKSDLERLLLADDASHDVPFVLIDVRDPSELVHGVIPGARNVPLGELHAAFALDDKSFLERFKFAKPTMDTHVVVYCRSGARSELATLMLLQLGWTATRNYRGSFKEWFGRSYTL